MSPVYSNNPRLYFDYRVVNLNDNNVLFLGVVQNPDVDKVVINSSDEGVYLEKKVEDERIFTLILPSSNDQIFLHPKLFLKNQTKVEYPYEKTK
ncbi:hypothetical protein EKG37_14915 [Robertmurraya yapensis]|uniref:Uncharacterized protein n=1 Tax=Bacillus yapensis TaxID=2492960 RepID=A0A3S0RJ46_9BACI|nr:hypothetical protein [Bacillus yapensis]RTR29582.1 hypothetical protein EKG37_14915 [Bacillus yapensis]TKS94928.1 hypothetical protein FAR12_14915 [Bacillus yapensis]